MRTVIIGFAIVIFIRTILFMFAAASTHGHLGLVNALFTSTSAFCVTGLTVMDTLLLSWYHPIVLLVKH